jgi:hypothetical protein
MKVDDCMTHRDRHAHKLRSRDAIQQGLDLDIPAYSLKAPDLNGSRAIYWFSISLSSIHNLDISCIPRNYKQIDN